MRVILILCLALPTLSRSPRIVGGQDADDGEWPWQLALFRGKAFNCGASLIRANWAITAAHCIGNAPSTYSVMAGTNNRTCEQGECQRRTCTVATRHPQYYASGAAGFPNDIAVISWDLAIDQTLGKIQYIPMATTTEQEGRSCFITGWGRLTGFAGSISPIWLQEANIDVLSRAECLSHWNENQISDKQVCVFDKATQLRGACNGDSGGPMVCKMDGGWELVGVTSWGVSGCAPNYPSIYTRVSSYHDWILATIGARTKVSKY